MEHVSDVRQDARDSRSDTGFFGQPGVLANLFGVELLISPVGLSATTKLAPKKFRTQMVGLYFPSIAMGLSLIHI